MKKLLVLFALLATIANFAQVQEDSLVPVKHSFYARSMFLSLTTGDEKTTTLTERVSQNIEFGKSIGVVDIGVALGNLNYKASDTTKYAQLRVSMDAGQYGIFSNDITVGAGYVFNSSTPIMLELSSTMFAQIGEQWGLGFVFGTYEFVGDTNEYGKNFYGLYFRWGLMRNEGGSLISRVKHMQRSKKKVKTRKRFI